MKALFFLALAFGLTACEKSNNDEENIPKPGTTKEFTLDIQKFDEGRYITGTPSSTSCMIVYAAEFDEDQYAKSYTVSFYNMQRTGGAIVGSLPLADLTVDVTASDNVAILNSTAGNTTYINWYNVNSSKSITRKPSTKKINVSPNFWCAGNGICGSVVCQTLTGKAKVTVRY
jgi:hypothetical protein